MKKRQQSGLQVAQVGGHKVLDNIPAVIDFQSMAEVPGNTSHNFHHTN
ncbi:Uncharacterized protein APZ42_000180 [Daphnia magna]|uniref:Uncharacterized protein n=1 Tax=Daphnia magna TaxID=35525 RepID=A0A164JV43_9CRUS|nr:Uncharacterized protein APZ42_000180 [Daphnia magna]